MNLLLKILTSQWFLKVVAKRIADEIAKWLEERAEKAELEIAEKVVKSAKTAEELRDAAAKIQDVIASR